MVNFRLNLDVTYRSSEDAKKASIMIKQGKKVPLSFFYPDETSIYISATVDKVYCKKNTGLKVKPKDFDVKTQSIKTRDTKSLQLQSVLNKIKDDCIRMYRDLMLNNQDVTVSSIKDILEFAVNPEKSKEKLSSFFEVYDDFFQWKKKTVKSSTLPRYESLKKQLLAFEQKKKVRLEFDKIDKKFSEEFSLYLIESIGITNNTISKYLRSLKCFMNYCSENDYTSNTKFKSIKVTEELPSIFVLEPEEIERIWNLGLSDSTLKVVRDVFCFLCFTGQRYSDVKRLKVKDIVNKRSHFAWRLYQFKTKATNHIDIPLLPEAQKLIDLYVVGKSQNDFVFDVITNQKMNDNLKVIGRMAEIGGTFTMKRVQGNRLVEINIDRSQKISTHTGRKSFITNALKKGVPITVVQKVSGHASLKSMRHYIEMSETFVAETLFECFKT